MPQSRLLGIDYGEKRIGLALSDPLQLISRPYLVISNKGENVFAEIEQIIRKKDVNLIILGLPLNLAGEETDKTREVFLFYEKLKNAVNIPVKLWDERYSSVEAKSILREMGIDKRDYKLHLDKIAASIILKDYLESLN